MKTGNTDFDNIVGAKTSAKADSLTWKKEGVYKLWCLVKIFLFGEKTKTKREDPFTQIAEMIVSTFSYNQDPELLKSSEALLHQQRMVEDTRARRRLETWTKRVISWYLICVFGILISNGVYQFIKESSFISDSVMIAILTTTTVNILGLGFIILKGHFHTEEKEK